VEEEDAHETEDSEEEERSSHRNRNPKSTNTGDELARLAGSQYDEGIDDQVDFERERTKSLEQRGIQVITTSGVLTTLLFGLAKFGPGITLELDEQLALIAALVLFVLAALFGLLANQVGRWEVASAGKLEERTSEASWFSTTASEAARQVAIDKVDWLKSARRENGRKADSVFLAFLSEVTAIAILAAAIVIALENRPPVVVIILDSVGVLLVLLLLIRLIALPVLRRPGRAN